MMLFHQTAFLNIFLSCILHRSKRWVLNLRRKDLMQQSEGYLYKNCVVCAEHFEDTKFMNIQERNKLIWCAIPTLVSVPNPPPLATVKRKPPKTRQPPVKRRRLDAHLRSRPDSSAVSTNSMESRFALLGKQ